MKTTKLLLALVLIFCGPSTFAQEDLQLTKKDSMVVSSWMFGVGINIVDDAGSEFDGLLDAGDNWNMVPFPSRISIGKYFKNGLGLEAIGTYNQYQEGKIIDNVVNTEDIDYFAVDLRASYDLNKILGETGFFDPYVGVGAGYTDANNQGRGTYNATVGFRTWFSDRWGLDFNSSGKWAMKLEDGVTNHIQHAVGVVYRFDTEKDLTPRGKEKLMLLQEMEKEQQRIQDSIAAAKRAEEEAKRLAEELERQKEAERLAAEERAKQQAEEARRKALQDKIDGLGKVYFALNSSYLNKRDKELLDELIAILQENPGVKIKVAAHTDSRGTEKYNQWLSERRMERTVQYLIDKGVSDDRILKEAYGETQLTNECDDGVPCSEEKHRENRRSEFLIVEF
ncbi:OmpA family protein [Flagellimonas lutaonensis]|uniref:OmpA/MotB domain protein n=1 Tax=Flagellimonas lutaonensis TaxID=516051 RepID=A0A0D5YW07_9FLAO|nr:OmpA family protein [Allomuricauda lutaonensis]AKA36059.1 OmpA/MotB domain protein [Allomuricauda lutaonensis]